MADSYMPTIVGSNPPPVPGDRPALVLLPKSGSLAGQERRFTQDLVTFGRAADNDLAFDAVHDAKVSSYHGRLWYDAAYQCWVIEDLKSTNGTYANGHRLSDQPVRLQSGDVLVLGDPSDPASVVIGVQIEGQAPVAPPVPPVPSAETPDTYVPAAPSAQPAEEEGFFGRLKGKYRRWNERREVSRQIEQATAELNAMKQRHLSVYAELGRQMVEGGVLGDPAVASISTTASIVGLQDAIAGKQREIAGVQELVGSLEQSLQQWLVEWQGRFDADEKVRADAAAALEAAKSENADADASLREMLSSRATGMKQVGQQFVQAGAQIESVPESTTLEHLSTLARSASELAGLLNEPLEQLPAAVERLLASRVKVGEAEQALAKAKKQVESREAERSAREAEHKSAVEAKNREIAEFERQIAGLRQQIAGNHEPLGRLAAQKVAAGQLSLQLPGVGAATAALDEVAAQERKLAELNRRLAELSQ